MKLSRRAFLAGIAAAAVAPVAAKRVTLNTRWSEAFLVTTFQDEVTIEPLGATFDMQAIIRAMQAMPMWAYTEERAMMHARERALMHARGRGAWIAAEKCALLTRATPAEKRVAHALSYGATNETVDRVRGPAGRTDR